MIIVPLVRVAVGRIRYYYKRKRTLSKIEYFCGPVSHQESSAAKKEKKKKKEILERLWASLGANLSKRFWRFWLLET